MNSNEEVISILRQAADVVTTADLPKELQAAAFGKAVDLLAGSVEAAPASKKPKPPADSEDQLQRIATKLEVDVEVISEFFETEDGNVKLTIAPSKLDGEKSKGVKQIAVLLAAARQAAGVEDWTGAGTIREVADDYGKFDSGNFARTIGDLGDYFSFSGTARSRRLKMRKAGFEQAGEMIKSLHGQV